MDELRKLMSVEISHYWTYRGSHGERIDWCVFFLNGVPHLHSEEDAGR